MSQSVTIPSEVAAHVLFHEGHGGYPAGSFTTKLLAAWTSADDANAARLADAFPAYGAAIALLRRGELDRLRAIAEGAAA
ncbi:hypothetical protein D7231_32030 [Streptomyces klenkii]|uniref:Uncharacterized protein n=1 Tax=Streptomyces klenkii TaxID=1420899 RepID=A0A3B0AMQ2_9ACTN|nr:hypothetical protein [Streptomyces klenkii]RKN61902.1 hypothetical protein D7231_32030 [Streptomyces klenkii]